MTDVQLNSRLITTGAVFISVARTAEARAAHIAQARTAGAIVVIGPPESDADIVVADPEAAAAGVACAFYRYPARDLTVVAITGTNGKSSITHTMGGVLRTLGRRVGMIGTIGITLDAVPVDVERRTPTTPESVDLQYILRWFADNRATHVVMEASSIALAGRRLDGTDVAVGCFTNLSHDHLDVHGSMAAYEAAKLHLFDLARAAVANVDDPVGRRIHQRWKSTRTFALHTNADLIATDLRRTPDGTAFLVHAGGRSVQALVRGFGEMSVSNALAVLATALELDVPLDDAARALAAQPGPPGRMQIVPVDRPYTVMVDYAHSPDALDQVLRTLRTGAIGRIVTVFGCGGDRDRAKRPVMGRIAAELSDQVVLTSDNPRTEDPGRIIVEILAGTTAHADRVRTVPDRAQAIAEALAAAAPGDLVLIAGKGSEPYQIIGHTKIPYSDEATVLSLASDGAV
ncbi:UDP-N-acetylmuramoyl-L-alanyl-D-glutamate--2,6-diaminopimelate ligase [Actinopolymorpha alba]|uniref:UDP-N-acetylmuramoyl-L-alanyl-D-glutamate--2, 6-diaminopimelate ligase n=1 Tax=Actinopolymorpha alba TaxID=533267 RepID=UPI00058D5095|nr:UDP-N-acetylmuramoyl-L-alanyl-D-glutamate--2,6-diaminopimelate ligase [Actinopolymorpha alba]